MKTKAIFHRNEPQFDLADCEIEKVITLPGGRNFRISKRSAGTV